MSAPAASEPPPPADADLIAASRSGDAAAYGTLYRRHAPSARALARHLVHGRAEAEDIVAEAFARVLCQLRRGGGPQDAFRPYLLTAVRRIAYDRYRTDRHQVATGEIEALDPGAPFVDTAVAGLERRLAARAFMSLPERWRTVLWHTEIEGARPAEVAPLLGLTPNGVAALAYRAREGLRQAYLQMHLSGSPRQECRPVLGRLGAYVRDGLSEREAAVVTAHLDTCDDCRAVYAELADVNAALRTIVAPVVLGSAAAGYLAVAGGGAGGAGTLRRLPGHWIGALRRAPTQRQAAALIALVAAAVIAAAAALALSGQNGSAGPAASRRPHGAAQAPPAAGRHLAHHPGPVPPAAPRGRTPPGRAPHQRHRPAPPLSPPPLTPPRLALPSRLPAASRHAATPRVTRIARRAHGKPSPPARLAARVNPVGVLLRGATGVVTFTVTDTGTRAARGVAAEVTLPPGVSYIAAGTPAWAVPGGWACRPAPAGAACAHGPIAAGTSTAGYIRVAVAPGAALGGLPGIRAGDGGPPVAARSLAGVAASGLPARYAADGPLEARLAGGAFSPCRRRPFRGAECVASTASLHLAGGVRWAGLYWSWEGDGHEAPIYLRGPGHGPHAVGTLIAPASAAGASLVRGGTALLHQGFADVTGLVAGGGQWTAAVPGGARYLGWLLVVVAADPGRPSGQVMVLDSAEAAQRTEAAAAVTPGGPGLAVPLDGLPPAARGAAVQVAAWDAYGGPHIASFTEPPGRGRAVEFSPGTENYLVGAVAATIPPDTAAAPSSARRARRGHREPAANTRNAIRRRPTLLR